MTATDTPTPPTHPTADLRYRRQLVRRLEQLARPSEARAELETKIAAADELVRERQREWLREVAALQQLQAELRQLDHRGYYTREHVEAQLRQLTPADVDEALRVLERRHDWLKTHGGRGGEWGAKYVEQSQQVAPVRDALEALKLTALDGDELAAAIARLLARVGVE